MRNRFRKIQVLSTLAVLLLAGVDAAACQPPEEKPLQQLLDEAAGGVRAKVMAAEVKNLDELGIPCSAVICDVLEVRLDVLEVIKGPYDENKKVHAPIPMMCVAIIMPGWEYVLFLEERDGLTFPNIYSFHPKGEKQQARLEELRDLAAR